jgi:hypothetical protein
VDKGGRWWQWRRRDTRGALWTTVVVEDNQGIGLLMTKIDRRQMPTIDLGVVCENGFRSGHSVMIPSG